MLFRSQVAACVIISSLPCMDYLRTWMRDMLWGKSFSATKVTNGERRSCKRHAASAVVSGLFLTPSPRPSLPVAVLEGPDAFADAVLRTEMELSSRLGQSNASPTGDAAKNPKRLDQVASHRRWHSNLPLRIRYAAHLFA